MRAPSPDLLCALRSAVWRPFIRQVPSESFNCPRHAPSAIRRHPYSRSSRPPIMFTCSSSISTTSSPVHGRDLRATTNYPQACCRTLATKSHPPPTRDRGPPSEEDTQTDFGRMDIFNTANVESPATSVDACVPDGFHLNNGIQTSGGAGILLLGGEAFVWRPWMTTTTAGGAGMGSPGGGISGLLSSTGVLTLPKEAFGVLELLYPKPDLLIVGTGGKLWMLAKETRDFLGSLGVRVDVMDTGNATAAYNLLATERGVEGGAGVGGAFLPVGWKGLSSGVGSTGKKR